MKPLQRRATDHRAAVLESVATNPKGTTILHIVQDCEADGFPAELVKKHVWQLKKEGLIGIRESTDGTDPGHFITRVGLDYLTFGRFDLPLPEPGHPRPGARRKKVKS